MDGDSVCLLCQVDNFAVASLSVDIANKVFALIQADLKQHLKILGLLTMHNGLDISQCNIFVKVFCATYLRKILEGHGWDKATHKSPIASPMNDATKYLNELDTSSGMLTPLHMLRFKRKWVLPIGKLSENYFLLQLLADPKFCIVL